MAVRKEKPTRSSTQIKRVRKREKDYKPQELCCCPPRAMVWIDTRTSCCFIENQIDMKRQLLARADAVASVQPPAGPSVNAESGGGTQFDETTFKDQGKVYRTDTYIIHWKADGQCWPLSVQLHVDGEVDYAADCLPEEGEVTLSHAYMLEPPDYLPQGSGKVTATLNVADCTRMRAVCQNVAPRP